MSVATINYLLSYSNLQGNSNIPFSNLRTMHSPNSYYHCNVTEMNKHFTGSIQTSIYFPCFQLTNHQQINHYKLPLMTSLMSFDNTMKKTALISSLQNASAKSQYATSKVMPWGIHLEKCPSEKVVLAANTLQWTAFEYFYDQFPAKKCIKFKAVNDFMTDCCNSNISTSSTVTVKLKPELTSLQKNTEDFFIHLKCRYNSSHTQYGKLFQFCYYRVHEINKLIIDPSVKCLRDYEYSSVRKFCDIKLLCCMLKPATVEEDMALLNHLTIKTRFKNNVILPSQIIMLKVYRQIIQQPSHICNMYCGELVSCYILKSNTNINYCDNSGLGANSYSSVKIALNNLVSVSAPNLLLNSVQAKPFIRARYIKPSHYKNKNTDVTKQFYLCFKKYRLEDSQSMVLDCHMFQKCNSIEFDISLIIEILVAERKLQLACLVSVVSQKYSPVCNLCRPQARVKLKSWDVHFDSEKCDCYRFPHIHS